MHASYIYYIIRFILFILDISAQHIEELCNKGVGAPTPRLIDKLFSIRTKRETHKHQGYSIVIHITFITLQEHKVIITLSSPTITNREPQIDENTIAKGYKLPYLSREVKLAAARCRRRRRSKPWPPSPLLNNKVSSSSWQLHGDDRAHAARSIEVHAASHYRDTRARVLQNKKTTMHDHEA